MRIRDNGDVCRKMKISKKLSATVNNIESMLTREQIDLLLHGFSVDLPKSASPGCEENYLLESIDYS
jgi:hypothetical protein